MDPIRQASKTAALMLWCAAVGACGNDATAPFDPFADYVFLTQPHDLDSYPDALFQGVVLVDAAGCFRLTGPVPDNSTVVWPAGSTFDGSGGALRIRDRHGADIGVVGDSFTLGGGHTSNLAAITDLSEAERATVTERCPGTFWLVSP